jgi:hypothetical protein
VLESSSDFSFFVHLDDGRILALELDEDEQPLTHLGVRTNFGAEFARTLSTRSR